MTIDFSSVTIGAAVTWIVAAAGSFVVLLNLWNAIAAKLKPSKDRAKSMDDRITQQAALLEKDKAHLDKIDAILEEQQRANGVMFRSMLALINHSLTGNGNDNLRLSRDEIQDYLTKR